MRNVRKLVSEADFAAFATIGANAYPGIKISSEEDRQKFAQRMMARTSDDPAVDFDGLFEDERLLGGMRQHDFVMNMRSARIKAAGVGFIAVDLLQKKRGVAKDLVAFFLQHCQEPKRQAALLYPFRADFYK